MYPEPIGPAGDQKPVLCWEDYEWSPGAGVRTAAFRIVEELWWRFKCDPLNQEQADAALEENFTNKVRQMLHEEKVAAIKRLNKKGQMPTEVDEEGNCWPTKEALISAKPPGFGTVIGWRLLCEHWSTAAFRKISFTNSKDRLAHGKTVFHCSCARSVVSTRQHLILELLVHGITHIICIAGLIKRRYAASKFLNVGHDVQCSKLNHNYLAWEDFDYAMTNTHGENWEEEHPELDAQIIYDAAGRMPHGRLGIANELFTKIEKSKIKSRRVSVSQPTRSAREDRLERDNDRLMRENKRLRDIDLVVRYLVEKGGVDYDGIMQSVAHDLATSDSEVGFERERDAVHQHETEKGMGVTLEEVLAMKRIVILMEILMMWMTSITMAMVMVTARVVMMVMAMVMIIMATDEVMKMMKIEQISKDPFNLAFLK